MSNEVMHLKWQLEQAREALSSFVKEMDRSSGRPSFKCYRMARAALGEEQYQDAIPDPSPEEDQ